MRWIVIGVVLGLLAGTLAEVRAQTPPPFQLTCETERDKGLEYVRALVSTQIRQEALLEQMRKELLSVTRERDQLKAAAPKAPESPPAPAQ